MQHRLRHTPHVGALPINRKKGWSPSNSEITTAYGDLTTPLSTAQLKLLDTFVTSLKTGLSITNLSDAFDVMYILANETEESSLRNLVKRAHDATAVNSPTFTALEGFTGDGSTAYLDSNYNPSTQGDNFVQNSASMGIYSRTNVIGGYDMGSRQTHFSVITAVDTGEFLGLLNSGASGYIDQEVPNRQGMFIITRDGALYTDLDGYRNKTKYNNYSGTGGTTGIESVNFYILARNRTGTGDEEHTTRQLSLAFAGGYLTEAQENALYDAFQAYMTANSKEV